jgi:hypothetical protein
MGGAAALDRLEREVVFLPGEETFVVFDRADTVGAAEAVWQLNSGYEPSPMAGGFLIDGAAGALEALVVQPASPGAAVVDWTTDADMNGGYRLDLRDTGGGTAPRFLVVLAPAGAVTTTSALADSGEIGVDVTFASGAHAVVRFDRAAIGASLALTAAGGATLHDGPLDSGLDTWPLFAQ